VTDHSSVGSAIVRLKAPKFFSMVNDTTKWGVHVDGVMNCEPPDEPHEKESF
jgi:hypothetical protein